MIDMKTVTAIMIMVVFVIIGGCVWFFWPDIMSLLGLSSSTTTSSSSSPASSGSAGGSCGGGGGGGGSSGGGSSGGGGGGSGIRYDFCTSSNSDNDRFSYIVYPSNSNGRGFIDVDGTPYSIDNITVSGTLYISNINEGSTIILQAGTASYGFKTATATCPTFTISDPTGYSCTPQAAATNNIKGFDMLTLNNSITGSRSKTTCASKCDSDTNCVGFAISSDNAICLLKTVNMGNYNDGASKNYFFCTNNSHTNQNFVICNKSTNSVLYIDDVTDWYGDWSSGNSRNIINRSYTASPSPIPAKCIWRYEPSDSTIRSTASNAFIYVDSTNVKFGYGVPPSSAKYNFFYDTVSGTSTPKSIRYDNGFIKCGQTVTNPLIASATYDTNKCSFDILFLPKYDSLNSLPTYQETFFIIKTTLNGTDYYVSAPTDSSNNVLDNNSITVISDNPYKLNSCMWSCAGANGVGSNVINLRSQPLYTLQWNITSKKLCISKINTNINDTSNKLNRTVKLLNNNLIIAERLSLFDTSLETTHTLKVNPDDYTLIEKGTDQPSNFVIIPINPHDSNLQVLATTASYVN
jgi:hypothetical protein